MDRGERMSVELVTNEKVAQTSSKGNQEKWKDGNKWYKLDQFGYEALAETVVSMLLEKSNIETETPFTFVRYNLDRVNVHRFNRTVCVSNDFLKEGQSIITVAKLFSKFNSNSFKIELERLNSDKKRIQYLVDKTREYTRLLDFDKYVTLLFEIDSLFLNDDRHLNNIAVLEKNGKYDYCPIFDNGAALLSNVRTLPMDIEPKGLMKNLLAKPFNMTFNRELKTTETLYGRVLNVPKFSRTEILETLTPLLEYYPQRDRAIIEDRIVQCITERLKMI